MIYILGLGTTFASIQSRSVAVFLCIAFTFSHYKGEKRNARIDRTQAQSNASWAESRWINKKNAKRRIARLHVIENNFKIERNILSIWPGIGGFFNSENRNKIVFVYLIIFNHISFDFFCCFSSFLNQNIMF